MQIRRALHRELQNIIDENLFEESENEKHTFRPHAIKYNHITILNLSHISNFQRFIDLFLYLQYERHLYSIKGA